MPDLHLIATFAVIAATIIAYASERWPMETVSLVSLAAILLLFGLFPIPVHRAPIEAEALEPSSGCSPALPTRHLPR
jgi:hypothetical protein